MARQEWKRPTQRRKKEDFKGEVSKEGKPTGFMPDPASKPAAAAKTPPPFWLYGRCLSPVANPREAKRVPFSPFPPLNNNDDDSSPRLLLCFAASPPRFSTSSW